MYEFTPFYYHPLSYSQHANLCRQWEKAKAASRAEELKRLKRDRFQSALDKLRQLGWGDELDLLAPKYKPLTRHEPLRAAQKLTDRIWQNIGGGVVAILEDIRDERYRTKHTEVLRKRLDALCTVILNKYSNSPRTVETEYKPHMCDIITMPEIREIVHSSNDAALGSQSEEKVRALLPSLVDHWQTRACEELTRLASRWTKCAEGADVLSLAATHFVCSVCTKLLPYPEVLAHNCLRYLAPVLFRHPYNQYMIYEIAAWTVGVNGQPWNSQLLIGPGQRFHERIRTIIKLCGQDPDRTTRQELKNLNVYISYPRYNDKNRVITLRTAVEKEWQCWTSKSRHDESVEYKGRIATEAELSEAQRGGQEVLWSKHDYPWCCSLCTPRGDDRSRFSLYGIQAHMQQMHSINNASEKEGNFYAYPECGMQPF
ncbi:predicted protein [Postia placenta Mad-698-R]|uniref:Uncharacterized protein n=1 Tax=Postia placenta MAD-698-R-SB12 TaxID=670580 RepID=A0A1X6N0R9_9APHY|nr:hypothetical protein POSPLADRAFT_1046606 [Postia placenta MAD-698-R-SB12]EED82249.1 predicted protein [Postia placenta Mad-698-R]OSX62229.1 hypothetical protein POSPLADRAFT_1046606 [Postia placenta MAD-698-R-SB12]